MLDRIFSVLSIDENYFEATICAVKSEWHLVSCTHESLHYHLGPKRIRDFTH